MSRSSSLAVARRPAHRVACVVALALLAAGCAERPRSNPLDPRNPETGGGPTGFTALAGNQRVSLSWQAAPNGASIGGFLVERRVHGAPAYAVLDSLLGPTTLALVDSLLPNDTEFDYRLTYVLTDGAASGAPTERTARPGPEVVWVSDPGVDEVARISPDGRTRVLTLGGLVGCNRVSVQLSGGELWGASPLDGTVRVYAPDGTAIGAFGGLSQPNALAVDPTSHTTWICEEGPPTPTARRWANDGTLLASGPTFGLATDVTIVPGGGAWFVDEQAGRLVRIDAAGTPQDTVVTFADPRRVARDPIDGSLWVTCYSTGAVQHVSAAGAVLATYTGFGGPYGVDIDEFRGIVWVGLDGENAVVGLRASDGAQLFRVAGLPHPRSLAVDDRTGECFVAAIASHELVRIASDGTVLSRNAGFSAPFDVKVDPGPR